MSTLADELLQDFEDSGSEGEGEDNAHLFADPEEVALSMNGNATRFSGASEMELDGDEEAVDEDDEMAGMTSGAVDATEDEETTKAKVEKMQLGGVDDVRSVAGLMKTLEPVLEVSSVPFFPSSNLETYGLHLLVRVLALTFSGLDRKLHIFNHYRPINRRPLSAQSKITRNIIC